MFIIPVEDQTPIVNNAAVSIETIDRPQSNETYLYSSNEHIDNLPRIPISHLVASNQQYPSLTNVPTNIAKSYAPIFIQPQQTQSENDIYTDYVNNPYNQTLKMNDHLESPVKSITDDDPKPLTRQMDSGGNGSGVAVNVGNNIANVFQSANYFGSDTINIPPGSEVLFGGP